MGVIFEKKKKIIAFLIIFLGLFFIEFASAEEIAVKMKSGIGYYKEKKINKYGRVKHSKRIRIRIRIRKVGRVYYVYEYSKKRGRYIRIKKIYGKRGFLHYKRERNLKIIKISIRKKWQRNKANFRIRKTVWRFKAREETFNNFNGNSDSYKDYGDDYNDYFGQPNIDFLNNLFQEAKDELRDLETLSRAFDGKIAGEFIPVKTLVIISIVEHLGHKSLLRGENKKFLRKVNNVIESHKKGMFEYTVSPKGANSHLQIMRSTYNFILKLYPEANLISDFYEGTRNIKNAAKASICLLDYNLSILLKNDILFLKDNSDIVPYLLAASYNCGVHRVDKEIAVYRNNWYKHLPRETRIYLLKYAAVENFIYPQSII